MTEKFHRHNYWAYCCVNANQSGQYGSSVMTVLYPSLFQSSLKFAIGRNNQYEPHITHLNHFVLQICKTEATSEHTSVKLTPTRNNTFKVSNAMIATANYGSLMRISPSLHDRKSNPNPKFLGMAKAYFVCHISPKFQISLIYAFIGCP